MSSTQYFTGFSTVEQIKSEYRRLAMKHHPDRGGDTATMQEVNRQYQEALRSCDGQKSKDTEGNEHTYRYDHAQEQEVIDALQEILRIKMNAEVEVWLIGRWIWIIGETRPVKDQLKELGCLWHGKRQAWYWRSKEQAGWHRYSPKNGSLGDLAQRYGARGFTASQTDKDLAA